MLELIYEAVILIIGMMIGFGPLVLFLIGGGL